MRQLIIDINGEDYVCELPGGYVRTSNRISFKADKPFIHASNGVKERYFPARRIRYMKKEVKKRIYGKA